MAVSTANTGLLNFSQIRYKSLDCAQNQTPNFATPLRSPDYAHVLNREPLVVGKIDVFPLTNSGAKISFASISPRKKNLNNENSNRCVSPIAQPELDSRLVGA